MKYAIDWTKEQMIKFLHEKYDDLYNECKALMKEYDVSFSDALKMVEYIEHQDEKNS